MKKTISLVAVTIIVLIATYSKAAVSIKNTKHNLSSWGQYNVKAATESQVCKFCHTPHNSESTQAPLWNHVETSTTTFTLVSTTHTWGLLGADKQPTGIAKKCLSCHDGTVAIGATLANGDIVMAASSNVDFNPDSGGRTTGKIKSTAPGYLGTNLRNTHFHPVSFPYETAVQGLSDFVSPLSEYNKKHMLDKNGKVQCHTCHNPHSDGGDCILGGGCAWGDGSVGKDPLWRKKLDCNGDNASVCGSCHKANRDANCEFPIYPNNDCYDGPGCMD